VKNFALISLILIVISITTKAILNLDNLVADTLSTTVTSEQLNEYVHFQKKWQWISYTVIPIILLTKTTLITSVLFVGSFFFNKSTVTFKQLFNVAIKAEFIFLGVGILKIGWFYFFQTNYTLEDIQYFFPLSALNIVGYKGLEPWLIYPFQILNLFELAYWLILAYFIGKITETNMDRGLKIVASSYGSALLLWVVVIMFFTLNYS
jgi:hypothetical protein